MKSLIGTATTSSAFCLPAVNNALHLANSNGEPWQTTNEEQDRYFEIYGRSGFDLDSLRAYLKGKVTQDAGELKSWFAEHGWDIDVNFPPEGLGIGSIFDLLVDWVVAGEKKSIGIRHPDKSYGWYEGAEMKANGSLKAYKLDGHEHPMFEIATRQDDWKVYLVEAPEACDPIDLPKKAADLLARSRSNYEFEKLHFPTVEMAADVDISWLKGLGIENGFRIDEAVKKVKLRVDDKGARAQSAVAITYRGLDNSSGTYSIELPFMVIFSKPDLEFPAFAALSAPDSWTKTR